MHAPPSPPRRFLEEEEEEEEGQPSGIPANRPGNTGTRYGRAHTMHHPGSGPPPLF
jgi:hypothetical protein